MVMLKSLSRKFNSDSTQVHHASPCHVSKPVITHSTMTDLLAFCEPQTLNVEGQAWTWC